MIFGSLFQNSSQACMLSYLLRDARKLLLVPVTSGACFYLLWSQIFDMMTCLQLLAVVSCNTQRWDREWCWTEDRRVRQDWPQWPGTGHSHRSVLAPAYMLLNPFSSYFAPVSSIFLITPSSTLFTVSWSSA